MEQPNESPMQKDCVCLQLHVRMPGVRAKADKAKVDLAGADEDMISVSKKIVDSDEYRRVRHCVTEMRSVLKTRSLPSPMLRGGFYMIPLPLIEDVEDTLDALKTAFNQHVSQFIYAYENGLVEDARVRLGELFNEEDYPAASALRKGFGVETMYISLDVPGRLRTVSQAVFEKEREAAEKRWRNLEQEAQTVLLTEMQTLVDRMVDQLGHTEDGRKKSFRESNVEKLEAFLSSAPFRNVNNDEELDKLCGVAKDLLSGVDVESIRKDDQYRNAVQQSFQMLKDQLDASVIDKPTRAISFEEGV